MTDYNASSEGSQELVLRMPLRQSRRLLQYCTVRNLSSDAVIIAALCALISGFEDGADAEIQDKASKKK